MKPEADPRWSAYRLAERWQAWMDSCDRDLYANITESLRDSAFME